MKVLFLLVSAFLFLYAVSVAKCQSVISDSEIDEIPDINEIIPGVPSPPPNWRRAFPKESDYIIKNISIDLEKLNITKFMQKLDTFKYYVIGNNSEQNSRRALQYKNSRYEYRQAQAHQYRTKILDIMLQTLFMAKHKMQEIENYVDTTDVSYRVSFTYERLKKIRNHIEDIYLTMIYYETYNEKVGELEYRGMRYCVANPDICGHRPEKLKSHRYVNPRLKLHQWAVKLHTDFLYLYWTMIKLHESYCKQKNCYARATTPSNITTTEDYLF